jgi:hypothetical protein
MKSQLPQTGTEDFLELLSPFVPDDYLNQRWPRLKTGGRRHGFSASQLFRLHLLALITPVHSFNLLIRMLPEQKAWRRFAHVPSQEHVPGVRMMNTFREEIGVDGLRQVNGQLLEPIIERVAPSQGAAALIDATDLPASCSGFKKKALGSIRPREPRWAGGRSRADKVNALLASRSTRFVSGFRGMNEACSWCPWSVGQRRPTFPKAGC